MKKYIDDNLILEGLTTPLYRIKPYSVKNTDLWEYAIPVWKFGIPKVRTSVVFLFLQEWNIICDESYGDNNGRWDE